jgi:hypothetical protein
VAAFRAIPGVRVEVVPAEADSAPVRSDVLGVALRARRGPVGERVRVDGWRELERRFGGLDPGSVATYAVRGYFENGGEVAFVVRVAGAGAATAWATWEVGPVAGRGGFGATRYRVEATSPGAWANRCRVGLRFASVGPPGRELARVTMTVECPGEPIEVLADLDPTRIVSEVAARSALVRLVPAGAVPALTPAPRHVRYDVLELEHGADAAPDDAAYRRALALLDDEPMVALVALPGLVEDVGVPAALAITQDAVLAAARERDRLVLVDPPDEDAGRDAFLAGLTGLGAPAGEAAVYLPRVRVADPFGVDEPLRTVPPSGHVAGVVSRSDRERGAHHTPAALPLLGVYDLAEEPDDEDRDEILAVHGNLLLCHPGRGVMVWGGRTLAEPAEEPGRTHVAHRRFIHRLVRVMRRVAEPLVFETNGPQTWLTLVRSLTTVLREAWRAGALLGSRPEEAFRVICDDTINRPEDVDAGRCMCEVHVALAAPMEFIVLRVALRRDGTLEVE